MLFDLSLSRRDILHILTGGAVLAAGMTPGSTTETRIGRLIDEARGKGLISQRLEFISSALRGTRYQGYTLIGGPRQPEQFVARDDAFDCVTFCETVLAAAIAGNLGEFDTALRTIRYHNGVVSWRERNHYFFEWGQHNIENNVCRSVTFDETIKIEKTVYWNKELGRRRFSIAVTPRAVFLANKRQLAKGDIVGFITQRPNLDYFHVGFITFDTGGELLLRHASQSRHRVLDERMDRFVAVNRVRYVTLLRPQERRAVAANG
jgi:N-acetylmuramoyl-L-alanine amidase-like protein